MAVPDDCDVRGPLGVVVALGEQSGDVSCPCAPELPGARSSERLVQHESNDRWTVEEDSDSVSVQIVESTFVRFEQPVDRRSSIVADRHDVPSNRDECCLRSWSGRSTPGGPEWQ
jgi:hypothetical protein